MYAENISPLAIDLPPYAEAKRASTAFGSVTVGYTNVITDALGDYIEVRNGTDKDVVMKVLNTLSQSVEILLPATDYVVRKIFVVHAGNIALKYASDAPTSGVVLIQSIRAGV